MTKKLEFAKKGCERSSFIQRPFFKVATSALVALNFTLGAPLLLPKMARAQDTATQAISAGKKVLPPELTKLPKISLTEMQKLDSATYRPDDWTGVSSSMKSFITLAHAKYPDGSGGIAVTAEICQDSVGCMNGLPDKHIGVASNGKTIAVIDLAPFAELYKKATGKELKFVKLIADNGMDAKLGQWVSMTVVPVDKPGGEIQGNVPALNLGFFKDESNRMGRDTMLISSL